MGQQKRSKRTTWISIEIGFENQVCPIFFLSSSLYIKSTVSNFLGSSGGDAVGSTKCLCTCVLLQKCSAHDKCHPETRTFALEWGGFKGGSKNHPCKMPITHRICALWLKGTLSMDSVELGLKLTIGQKEQERSRMGYICIRNSNRM